MYFPCKHQIISTLFFFFSLLDLTFFFLLRYTWLTMFQVYSKVIQLYVYIYIQLSSVTHLCQTLYDPMDCSTTGCPSPTSKLTQTHVHRVADFILCCPMSFSVVPFSYLPSIRVFKWVSSSHLVAKVLEFQLQHQSFQWILRTDFL